jgi:hypothetical protein
MGFSVAEAAARVNLSGDEISLALACPYQKLDRDTGPSRSEQYCPAMSSGRLNARTMSAKSHSRMIDVCLRPIVYSGSCHPELSQPAFE